MNNNGLARISRKLMYEEFSRQVSELISREDLWGTYLAPERELARLFEVSRETVRRGLDLLERQGLVSRRHGRGTLVLPKTRDRAETSKGRVIIGSYQIGGAAGYMGPLMSGLAAGAGDAGWLVSFSNLAMPATRQAFFDEISGGKVDGVILSSFTDRPLLEELVRIWSGPTVLADHYFEGLPVTGVIDDSEGGARQATEHLLSLGHRRIGYVELTKRELNPWRYAGYAGALADAGLEIDESLIVPSFGSFDGGRRAGEELLALNDPPTAVLAFDDLRAWGVWRAAEARGLTVGRDFALVGFGDSAAGSGFPEELSSVRFEAREVGRLAARKLVELIEGRGKPGELVKVPTELVIRKSSKDARKEGVPR